MDVAELLPFLMFLMLLIFLIAGFPVAFTIGGTALLFAAIGNAFEIFIWSDLGFIPSRIFGIMTNYTLVAVPLFIFMGLILEKSGIAANLLKTITYLLRGYRASLVSTVIIVGAILAASTGIVGATVVTMGVISLPSMLEKKYNKSLATGVVAASGTLGQIIPPSIVLVLLGDIMSVDVSDLFMGALIPGLILVLAYLVYVNILLFICPTRFPTIDKDCNDSIKPKEILKSLLEPALLMILVLGSILIGLATPTESASCGVFGALLIASLNKLINWQSIKECMYKTAEITSMVFLILITAQFFGIVFRGLYGDEILIDLINSLPVEPQIILFAILILLFILGFFLDFLEICFIVVPIILPIMVTLGYDKLWLAVIIALNLQTSFLTPPFGFALFYLKGVAPKEVSTQDIYKGVIPFILIQLLIMGLTIIFPSLVTYLPGYLNTSNFR